MLKPCNERIFTAVTAFASSSSSSSSSSPRSITFSSPTSSTYNYYAGHILSCLIGN